MGNQPSSAVQEGKPLTSSQRTEEWVDENGDTVRLSSLHGNLLRHRHHRDPLKIFEITELLGQGSMGNVARVRKRTESKGGSARPTNRSRGPCFGCPMPWMKHRNSSVQWFSSSSISSSVTSSSRSLSAPKSSLYHQQSSIVSHDEKEMVYALKSIHLDQCSSRVFQEELKNEVEVLKQLDHPHIVRCLETYTYKRQLYILLELCSGGDLYTRDPYTEEQAKNMIGSLTKAVAYLHDKGVVHRDLKYENIMFVSPGSDAIKIIDFGLSQKFASDEHLHDTVGTIYTMAPELIRGDYDSKADVWSVGVITFMLLVSSMPFYGKSRESVMRRIIRGEYSMNGRRWRKVSASAQDFVNSLLQAEPENRPSSSETLGHAWLNEVAVVEPEKASHEEDVAMDKVQAAMQAFAKYGQLKKLALMVVAYKSTLNEIGFLREIFDQFDTLKKGVITIKEFRETLQSRYDYSDEEVDELFRGLDINGEGILQYSEFLAATLEAHGSIDEERLAEAFDRMDSDDTGYISVSNLQALLGDDISDRYLNNIIEEADITHDHRISYDEFLAMWDVDDDAMLADIKSSVQEKKLRQSDSVDDSFISTASSVDSVDSGPNPVSGKSMFSVQKAQSVRFANV